MLATPAAPDAGDVKTSAVFAVQASPLPDKLIKSLPVDGTVVDGTITMDMVTLESIAAMLLRRMSTAFESTIAGNEVIEDNP